jgi:hypothetical protein
MHAMQYGINLWGPGFQGLVNDFGRPEVYRVLHLSAPERDRLRRGRQW